MLKTSGEKPGAGNYNGCGMSETDARMT